MSNEPPQRLPALSPLDVTQWEWERLCREKNSPKWKLLGEAAVNANAMAKKHEGRTWTQPRLLVCHGSTCLGQRKFDLTTTDLVDKTDADLWVLPSGCNAQCGRGPNAMLLCGGKAWRWNGLADRATWEEAVRCARELAGRQEGK